MTLVPSLALALLGAIHPPVAPTLAQDFDLAQDYWSEVARALGEQRGVAAVLPPDPAAAEVRARLADTRLAGLVIEEEESLTEVFLRVQTVSGLPIVVDPRAENDAIDEGLVIDANWPNPIAVEQVLDLIVDLTQGSVRWTVRDGVALVTTAERALDPRVPFLHPIADLLGTFELDDAAQLVQENVFSGSWENDGVAMEPTGAFLLVVHTREAQLAVEAFLADLRAFQASLDSPPEYAPVAAEQANAAQLTRLDEVRLVPSFGAGGEPAHLTEVAAFLQELTGMNFVLSRGVREELDEDELLVRLEVPETSVRNVLDLIVETREHLRWTVEGDLVRFRTVGEAPADLLFAAYDVRDIVSPADPEHVGAFAVGGDELEALVLDRDLLEDLIRNQIEPVSWDSTPECSLRISEEGILLMSQSPGVHARVRELLEYLHEIARIQLEVRERVERGR